MYDDEFAKLIYLELISKYHNVTGRESKSRLHVTNQDRIFMRCAVRLSEAFSEEFTNLTTHQKNGNDEDE